MPEGDTLHRAAKTLHRALAGTEVTQFESAYAHVAVAAENHPVVGATVDDVVAVGKHLVMHLSTGYALRSHMRMNGSWHLYRHGERWRRPRAAMRLRLCTERFEVVGFDVPDAELVSERQLRRGVVGRLGPDLLAPDFDLSAAIARLRQRAAQPIGELLLNQQIACGIGNVYKSEVCFVCGVLPQRRGNELSDEQLKTLYETARQLMQANVQVGSDEGIVTYSGLRRTTRAADPSQRLWVYGRGGEPCRRCRAKVQTFKQGLAARSTYFCPGCQH